MAISTIGQNGLAVPLVTSADASISGLTVGKGGGNNIANTATGYQALSSNSTGVSLNAFGYRALANSTGSYNCAFGESSMVTNTSGASNSAFGHNSLALNTTGSSNTGLGQQALFSNTTASNNTAVGYQAGYSTTTSSGVGYSVYIGHQAGYTNTTGYQNTIIGGLAGYNQTGISNTFIGYGAGYAITSGQKNTIIGQYNGNVGGLDIRTASNYIVLSDGDGNPRGYCDNNGSWKFTNQAWVKFVGSSGSISASYNVSSVTRNGTGDYTLNFATAMPDGNYSFIGTCTSNAAISDIPAAIVTIKYGSTPSTTACQFWTGDSRNGNKNDMNWVNIAVFR